MPKAECRIALGLAQEAPLVLFAGIRRPEKRFDLVEAAVARLRATRPDVQLVVAEREPHERMPLYMNACDVLILASEAEGSPMVIKEAMACNLPIVSVDVGDVAEIIPFSGTFRGTTPGGTSPIGGCFLAERNPASLAAFLGEALDFGRRTDGRAVILAGRDGLPLSLEAVAERIEAIYREEICPSHPT
jgi:glycosyltransferase involved in cell wall biosynthesis